MQAKFSPSYGTALALLQSGFLQLIALDTRSAGQEQEMFVLAGAAAGVLDYLGAMSASRVLQGSAAARAGQTFDVGAPAPRALASSNAAVGSRSSPETMAALISTQGLFGAGAAGITGAGAAGLLGSMMQQVGAATTVRHAFSTLV